VLSVVNPHFPDATPYVSKPVDSPPEPGSKSIGHSAFPGQSLGDPVDQTLPRSFRFPLKAKEGANSMKVESKEEYEQRIIKEITAFPDRLDNLAKRSEQLRSAKNESSIINIILAADKDLKEIQLILNEIKNALELNDVDIDVPEESKITNVNYPFVQQAITSEKDMLDTK